MKAVRTSAMGPGMKFGYRCVERFTFAPPVDGFDPIELSPGDGLTLTATESPMAALAVSVAKQAVIDGYLVSDQSQVVLPGVDNIYTEVP